MQLTKFNELKQNSDLLGIALKGTNHFFNVITSGSIWYASIIVGPS